MFLLLFSYCFLTLGQVCAKLAGRSLGAPDLSTLLFATGTYLFFALRGVLWVFLLRKVKLVLAYPLMSVGYILVLFVSVRFFQERFTPGKVAGALLVILGVTAVSHGEALLQRRRR
ncbi:MAG TPA: hypothetical protein ENN41_02630 [Sediminispirochaeta sp.]|nr:hypothetical protein [Sediminispirochaeta sp.]